MIKLNRFPEWTLRPLHMAISAGAIDPDTAAAILTELTAGGQDVTAPVVAATVAGWHTQTPEGDQSPQRSTEGAEKTARAAPTQHVLVARLRKLRQGMERVSGQVERSLDAETKAALMQEAAALMQSLEHLVQTLGELPGAATTPEDSR